MNRQITRNITYKKWWDARASDYEQKVLSPLYPGVINPIYDFVYSLDSAEYGRVADLGCGGGQFLPFLAKHFEEVWGIDWSEKMLKIAGDRTRDNTNVQLRRLDIRNMETFYNYFDLSFAINSITPGNPQDVKKILREIFKSLRRGGLFAAIFPSLDAILYQRELTHEAYIENGLSRREAKQKTDDYFFRRNKLDLRSRMYAEDGVQLQKFYTENEIHSLLKTVGFEEVVMKKALYPWDLVSKYGYGYFPGKPDIWDWFTSARTLVT